MSQRLEDKIAALPTEPGVYLFKGRKTKVLYIGKAKSLRDRVRQYFSGHDERPMVPHLVRAAVDVDVIVTTTEKEALLLENTLIKQYRPRFNVKLRDDATYMHLRLDLNEAWPHYTIVRRPKDDGALYFGPYASAHKARHTLTFLSRIYPLRTCTDHVLKTRSRPCLLHQMGRCVAPCTEPVDRHDYLTIAKQSTDLLKGRTKQVERALHARMMEAAEAENFEEAARVRDLIRAISATTEKQRVVDPSGGDRDVWGVYRHGRHVATCVIPVREGRMGEAQSQLGDDLWFDDDSFLSSALNAWYELPDEIPTEILLPLLPSDHEALAQVLSERKGRKVRLLQPKQGDKAKLVGIAHRNARLFLEQRTDAETRRMEALQSIAKILGLKEPPLRMECFDNSHLSGTNPVAAMAVFTDGQPDRREYRRYRIKTAMGGDDYGGMREILSRRFARALQDGEFPDLLVIDGGKGQVAAAKAALEDLGVQDQPMVGIVKPRTDHAKGNRSATDRLVLPNVKDPIKLPQGSAALRMLQHLRDETHNTAVEYQRKTRQKKTVRSILEGLPGIGPAKRKALLKHFGSARAVTSATAEQLAEVEGIGPKTAEQLVEFFHSRKKRITRS